MAAKCGCAPRCGSAASLSLSNQLKDLSRRAALTGGASVALPATLAIRMYLARPPAVATKSRLIEGRRMGGVCIFKGIPYGEPMQDRRFRSALLVQRSSAIVRAIDYGSQALNPLVGSASPEILLAPGR